MTLLTLVPVLFSCADRVAIGTTPPTTEPSSQWASALKRIASPDGINATALRDAEPELNAYLAWAAEHGQHSDGWGESKEDKRIAFLVNVHNAAVLHNMLRNNIPSSPDDVRVGWYRWPGSGFYWGSKYKVDGEWSAIRHIGFHDAVSRYQEPLIWAALYDGTKDSPPLKWWSQKKLQKRLKGAMRAFVNSDRGLRKNDNGWTVNPLFIARSDDFTFWTDSDDICDWMSGFSSGERKQWLDQQGDLCTLQSWIADRRTDVDATRPTAETD